LICTIIRRLNRNIKYAMTLFAANKEHSLIYLVAGIIIIAFQSCVLLLTEAMLQLKINLVLQLVLLIVFACWSFKKSRTYLSAPLIFVLAIYFWHSTFLTGHYLALGELFEYTGAILTYGEPFVPKASAMVALSMALAITGVLLGYIQQGQKSKGKEQSKYYWPHIMNNGIFNNKRFSKIANRYAWMCYLSFLIVSLLYLTFEGYSTFDQDIDSLYINHSTSFLYRFYQSTKFFGVVVILMAFATVRTKKNFVILAALSAGLIFTNILMGSRSMPFIYALTFLICIDLFFKKLTLKQVVLVAVSASALSYIIDNTRVFGLGLRILDFGQTGKSLDLIHIFWNAGGSIQTVLRTMEFSVETGLLYGQSIFDAIVYLLPRALIDGIGLHTGFTPLSEWLVERSSDVKLGGGLGYSLVAESYINFGIFGCILFALVGWFVAKKYYAFTMRQNIFGGLHAFNVAIILSLNMRNELGTCLRFLIYGYILIEILRILSRRRTASEFGVAKNYNIGGSEGVFGKT